MSVQKHGSEVKVHEVAFTHQDVSKVGVGLSDTGGVAVTLGLAGLPK